MKAIYEAEDGRQFTDDEQCQRYERIDREASLAAIESWVEQHGSTDDRGDPVLYPEDLLRIFTELDIRGEGLSFPGLSYRQ